MDKATSSAAARASATRRGADAIEPSDVAIALATVAVIVEPASTMMEAWASLDRLGCFGSGPANPPSLIDVYMYQWTNICFSFDMFTHEHLLLR